MQLVRRQIILAALVLAALCAPFQAAPPAAAQESSGVYLYQKRTDPAYLPVARRGTEVVPLDGFLLADRPYSYSHKILVNQLDKARSLGLQAIYLNLDWADVPLIQPISAEDGPVREEYDFSRILQLMDEAAVRGLDVVLGINMDRAPGWILDVNTTADGIVLKSFNPDVETGEEELSEGRLADPAGRWFLPLPSALFDSKFFETRFYRFLGSSLNEFRKHPALIGYNLKLFPEGTFLYPGGGLGGVAGFVDYSAATERLYHYDMMTRGKAEHRDELLRLDAELLALVPPNTEHDDWPPEALEKEAELNLLVGSLEKSPPFPKSRGMFDFVETDPQWLEWMQWRVEQKRKYFEAASRFVRQNDPDHLLLAGCETIPMGQLANGYLLETGAADYHWLASRDDLAGLVFSWTMSNSSLEFGGDERMPDYKLPYSISLAQQHDRIAVVSLGLSREDAPSSEKISAYLSFLRGLGASIIIRDGVTSQGDAQLKRRQVRGILSSTMLVLPEEPRIPQRAEVKVLDCPEVAGKFFLENADRLKNSLHGMSLLFDAGVSSAPFCPPVPVEGMKAAELEDPRPLVVLEPMYASVLGIEGGDLPGVSPDPEVFVMNPSAGMEYHRGCMEGAPNPLLVKGVKDRLRDEAGVMANEYPGNDLVLAGTWPYIYIYARSDHDSTEEGHAVKFLVTSWPLPDRKIHEGEDEERAGGYRMLNLDTGEEIRCTVQDGFLIIDTVRFDKGQGTLYYLMPDNASTEEIELRWDERRERLKQYSTQQNSLLVVILGLSVLVLILFLTFILKKQEIRERRSGPDKKRRGRGR